MTDRSGKMEAQAKAMTDDLGRVAEQAFVPPLRSYGVWLDSVARVQVEILQFMAERMRKDLEMPARLADCKGPVELFEVQSKFARTMVSDYISEAEKLLSLSVEGLRRSAGEASRTAELSSDQARRFSQAA